MAWHSIAGYPVISAAASRDAGPDAVRVAPAAPLLLGRGTPQAPGRFPGSSNRPAQDPLDDAERRAGRLGQAL